jgi:target of rapamycin complex subunit LST8
VSAHQSYPLRCRFSKNARYVATCSADRTIKVWELQGQRCVLHKTLSGHSRWVWDIAFSADSQYIVSASSDRTLKLWDVANEKILREYQGHQNAVTCLALNDSPRT